MKFYLIVIPFLISCCKQEDSKKIEFLETDADKLCVITNLKLIWDSINKDVKLKDSLRLELANSIITQTCVYPRDSYLLKLADNFHDLGNSSINLLNSRIYYQSALNFRKQFYKDTIHLDILRALINIGNTYANEGNYLEALRYYDSADIRQERFLVFPFIYNQTRKSTCYINLNDFNKALECLNLAHNQVLDCINKPNPSEIKGWATVSSLLYDLMSRTCNLYRSTHQYQQSLKAGLEGISLVRKWSLPQDSLNGLANLYISIGNTFQDSANTLVAFLDRIPLFEEAIKNYTLAETYYKKVPDYKYSLLCIGNIGSMYEKIGNYEKAQQILDAGIKLCLEKYTPAYKEQLLNLYINIGTIDYRQDSLLKSIQSYHSALMLIDSIKTKENQLPTIEKFYKNYKSSLILLGSLGRVYLKLAEKDKQYIPLANTSYDSLIQLINYIRGNLVNDQAKITLAEQSRQWIPDAFDDTRELYEITNDSFYKERAFQIVEQSKAFSLLEASRLNNASELLPKELKAKQKEVANLQLQAAKSDSLKELSGRKQREFLLTLKEKAPSYFALKYQGVDLNVKDIQQTLLASNQGMIEYFIQDSNLNIFYISKSDFVLDTIQILKQQLKDWIQSFQSNMNPVNPDGSLSQEKVKTFCSSSLSLYEVLIGKLKKAYQLPERLIIIPDGILNDLSFDALLTRISGNGDDLPLQVQNENFLVNHHTISYCFSANLLREMNREKSHNDLKPQLALFAPSFQSESDSLPKLQYQQKEIDGIKKQITNCKLDKASTKDDFIKASRTYSYLHVSSHGYVSDNPDYSFLAFSQKTATTDASQLLYLKELYNYPMNQELITLTACETALGQQREGEGNISLARGFAYAGVKSFITTLWKIQTNGASKIIPGFYNHLFNLAEPKDVALTNSKREFLKAGKGVYPENWAGLILIGSTNKVTNSSSTNLWIFYLMGILVLSVIAWILSKRKLTQRSI